MLKDDLRLSREYINKEETDWDYICRLFNENAYYCKGDDEKDWH